jgi:Activator of Hsp90 ATPase homolog 1-like protein
MAADPLVIEFEVGVAPAHAFDVWTRRCATWWPRSHTMSGAPSAISFEPRSGGRIVEHAAGGDHEWGEVLDWEPPRRLRCLWHPFFDRSEATELDVTFRAVATGTAVRLEQRGWERLGEAAAPRRTRTEGAWSVVAAAFAGACTAVQER